MINSPLNAEPPPVVTAPRLGFLGVGWIGRRRMEAIAHAGAGQITALADPSPELRAEAAQSAPNAKQCASLEELLEMELDGLVIATPSALHAGQTIAALERGVPVFCQKPLGRNAAEVRAIVKTARRANRLLGVDLSYRFVEGMQKMRVLIQGGQLGDIFGVDLVFHNAYGPQKPWFYDKTLSGGGCLIDLGIHLVDAALWTLDTTVIKANGRVFANGKPLLENTEAVEDYASALLDLANGAVVNLTCSWRLHAGRDAVIEAAFFGTRGGAAMRNVNGSFVDFRTERFNGTQVEVLSNPPEEWGGRAAVAWARQLSQNPDFDPEIERQIHVAAVLDAIYGHPAILA